MTLAFIPAGAFAPRRPALASVISASIPAPVPTMSLSRRSLMQSSVATAAALLLSEIAPHVAEAQTTVTAPASTVEAAAKTRAMVRALVKRDPTMAATLLRLAFHDTFTFDIVSGKGGANGSIRLETGRGENFGLERAVKALEPIQAETGLSWGDVVAVAGAEAVTVAGGPVIDVPLGRTTAEVEDPRGALPSLTETVDELRARFEPRGFNDRDLVALSGAHTLGKMAGNGEFTKDSATFKNDYFKNLMWFQERREKFLSEKVGPPDRPNFQLPSDIHLLDDPKTLAIVKEFGKSEKSFFDQFVQSYIKMVNVGTPMASNV